MPNQDPVQDRIACSRISIASSRLLTATKASVMNLVEASPRERRGVREMISFIRVAWEAASADSPAFRLATQMIKRAKKAV